ncbi:hypothetical protein Pcinc_018075, partial [Petrolisthes cinctipes]
AKEGGSPDVCDWLIFKTCRWAGPFNTADGDAEGEGEADGSGGRKQQLNNKLVPFGAGGPLLAQAKISESQQDFFMMLDEKIENGPDYDSETEEGERRRRLQEYAQQWSSFSNPCLPPPPSPPRHPDDDTCGSGEITEEDEEEDDEPGEPGRIPDEAVREQYMFMGSVYTLTHVRTDADKVEPKVDVVVVPQINEPEPDLSHKLNGSAVPEETIEEVEEEEMDEESVDNKAKPPPSKPSSRPASLILKSVFPPDCVPE